MKEEQKQSRRFTYFVQCHPSKYPVDIFVLSREIYYK